MKKKFSIFWIIGLSLLLNACAVKPEVTIGAYFTEIKTSTSTNFDTLTIQKYFDSEVKISENNQVLENTTDESNEMTDRYMELFKGFEYTIKETVVEGDTATVNVEILTYPMGELFANYVTQIFTKAFTWAFSGVGEAEITQKSNALFIELAADLEKTYTKTIPVYLIKVDDKWLMMGGDKNIELFNALTGGLIDFAKQFSDNNLNNG